MAALPTSRDLYYTIAFHRHVICVVFLVFLVNTISGSFLVRKISQIFLNILLGPGYTVIVLLTFCTRFNCATQSCDKAFY